MGPPYDVQTRYRFSHKNFIFSIVPGLSSGIFNYFSCSRLVWVQLYVLGIVWWWIVDFLVKSIDFDAINVAISTIWGVIHTQIHTLMNFHLIRSSTFTLSHSFLFFQELWNLDVTKISTKNHYLPISPICRLQHRVPHHQVCVAGVPRVLVQSKLGIINILEM